MQEGSLLNRDTDESNDDNTADVSSKHSKLQQPFKVNWDVIESLPHVNQLHDKRLRSYYASLAYQVQSDLETVAMDYVTQLRLKTGAKNLVLCGGVALNSVLNGRIMRDAGYDNVYITNHPGDEGISAGCAAFGLRHYTTLLNAKQQQHDKVDSSKSNLLKARVPFWATPNNRSPYQGKRWSDDDILQILDEYQPWLDIITTNDSADYSTVITHASQAIAAGSVVGWYQGRSEYGPRALGSRSILADPRGASTADYINAAVKKREDFRPFAPSVLLEYASEWFHGIDSNSNSDSSNSDSISGDHSGSGSGSGASPYMSITVPVKDDKRSQIPAVCHVDGSSRIQTLNRADNELYHDLITAFYKLTGVPMSCYNNGAVASTAIPFVLNTSFNVMKEPIVDSPEDAVRKQCPLELALLSTTDADSSSSSINSIDVLMMPQAATSFLSEITARDNGEHTLVSTTRCAINAE
eukprot:12642-Heterococcus_DN1.PRE.1